MDRFHLTASNKTNAWSNRNGDDKERNCIISSLWLEHVCNDSWRNATVTRLANADETSGDDEPPKVFRSIDEGWKENGKNPEESSQDDDDFSVVSIPQVAYHRGETHVTRIFAQEAKKKASVISSPDHKSRLQETGALIVNLEFALYGGKNAHDCKSVHVVEHVDREEHQKRAILLQIGELWGLLLARNEGDIALAKSISVDGVFWCSVLRCDGRVFCSIRR